MDQIISFKDHPYRPDFQLLFAPVDIKQRLWVLLLYIVELWSKPIKYFYRLMSPWWHECKNNSWPVSKDLCQLLGYFSLSLGWSGHWDLSVTWLILLNSSIHSTDIFEGQLWIRHSRIPVNQTGNKSEPLAVLAE